MAAVARRLGVPHATVRNYYQGRLPAPEVLIKIAEETGVSLNWLLIGTGEMYAGDVKGADLDQVLEKKISEMIDRRLSGRKPTASIAPKRTAKFDVEAALKRLDDPGRVMKEWFRHEGRKYPADYGVAFFRGWELFSAEDKAAAVRDAKRVLDKVLSD